MCRARNEWHVKTALNKSECHGISILCPLHFSQAQRDMLKGVLDGLYYIGVDLPATFRTTALDLRCGCVLAGCLSQ